MKTRITHLLIAFALACTPTLAFAAIDVDFESTPLFGESNFLPGDTISKTVTVTNTGDAQEDVYTELLNVVDGGLSDMVSVVISSGGTLFSGSFDDYDDAGEVFLTTLGSGDTVIYTFAMHFAPQADNAYQLKSLAFDICIGFSGGQFECDSDEPNYSQGSYGGDYSQGSYNGYSQGSYGGNGERIELRTSGDQSVSTDEPVPQVAGESDSILPFGAPNTGFGWVFEDEGSVVKFAVLCTILAMLCGLVFFRKRLQMK